MNRLPKLLAVGLIVLLVGCDRSNQQASQSATALPPMQHTGKQLQADADMSNLSAAIGLYKSQTGSLPRQLADLTKNPGAPGWSGPRPRSIPNDPWGHPYIYHPGSGDQFKLLSAGPDGQEGTSDDIGN